MSDISLFNFLCKLISLVLLLECNPWLYSGLGSGMIFSCYVVCVEECLLIGSVVWRGGTFLLLLVSGLLGCILWLCIRCCRSNQWCAWRLRRAAILTLLSGEVCPIKSKFKNCVVLNFLSSDFVLLKNHRCVVKENMADNGSDNFELLNSSWA